ncbi:MAG: hypothetical protein JJU02_13505 [Cryomorphaceae bacterium]|nr:hypothetical protein [Cryomorphaceae bacterium]
MAVVTRNHFTLSNSNYFSISLLKSAFGWKGVHIMAFWVSVLFGLSSPDVFAQKHGAISFGFGGGKFVDDQMNGMGMNISIQSPYLLKPEKIFLKIGRSNYAAEGNRNFNYDPSRLYPFSTNEFQDFLEFNNGFQNPDSWKPIGYRTSQSSHTSFELTVNKAMDFGNKHRIVLGLGVFRARILQHFVVESIDLELLYSNPFNPDNKDLIYHIPFTQNYRYYHIIGNLQYHFQVSDSVFLLVDAQYFHKESPFSGNLFFSLGMGVSL